jgi:hypothetical protein
MNERIKKLANIWANRRAEDEQLGITYTFSEKALDAFAEYVVKEYLSDFETDVSKIKERLNSYEQTN